MHENKEQQERVLLVGVQLREGDGTAESLEELAELSKTAGAVPVGVMIQKRERIHPGSYIGKGKILEVKDMMLEKEASCVVCDDELSPAQIKNLEEALEAKVIDRTVMILDIFARHAFTREGKLQVELAQLKYRSSRLIGLGNSLSRLGGGIGTRGPGEKKLEVDRRVIRDRISQLKKELEEVVLNREVLRRQRNLSPIPVVAIVGYTNAGKSTLLNRLTDARVLEEDKLFATLDPTTRNRKLPSGQEVLLTDTVGFIRKLPHHLIEAFRSTLEEAKYADLILHVVDTANPQAGHQMDVVYETLEKLKVQDKPIITVFNKQDQSEPDLIWKDLRSDAAVKISAKTGEGISELLDLLECKLQEREDYLEALLPYNQAGSLDSVRRYGQLLEEDYREDGIWIRAYLPKDRNFLKEL